MDQATIIRFGQGIAIEPPHGLIHEAFGKVAADNPSTAAVEHDGDQMTYAELDLASTILSRKILQLGVRPRDRVVLLVQRSIPMVVAIFAVLKSGCQYVPMDGGVTSDDALTHVLSELEPPVVLCLTRYSQRAHQFAGPETQVMPLEGSWTSSTDFDLENGHGVSVDPDDGAYVIYTSGSTGRPKGVDVTHRNVTNLLTLSPGNLDIKPGRRVAQLLSISFDMGKIPILHLLFQRASGLTSLAAWEILVTLMNGGTLCIRTSDWNKVLTKVGLVQGARQLGAKISLTG